MSRIVLFGASGLVGGAVLARLASRDVTAIGRRAVGNTMGWPVKLWPQLVGELKPDVVISALGTTIRKAGSQVAFAAIDHDAVVAIADAAKAAGARQFLMVSSVGAAARSANFYLRTKGQTEDDVTRTGFDRLDIFRPGLLVGERAGDRRPMERAAALLSPLTNLLTPSSLDRYRAIDASDVAAAIVACVGALETGRFVHHNREMLELTGKAA